MRKLLMPHFFSSLKSLNPGIAHLRKDGFLSLDLTKTEVTKKHDVAVGGLEDGINTTVDMTKKTLFRAGKGPGITIEAIADQDEGRRIEKMKGTFGERTVDTKASS